MMRWQWFWAVMALLTISGWWQVAAAEAPADPQAGAAKTATVTLVIDYSDGVQKHFTALAWKDGLTVLDALQAAAAHPRGIRVESRGSGSLAFVTKIDDVANSGKGKNWLYRVNGKRGDVSCGAQTLAAGDSVLWKFEAYR